MNKSIAIICGGISLEKEISIKSGRNIYNIIKKINKNTSLLIFPNEFISFMKNKDKFDLVIPVFHGIGGEDGQIFAFLKQLGIKYLFSDFDTHCIAINKYITNLLVEKIGGIVPKNFLIEKGKNIDNIKISYSNFIVKPNKGGSSFDTKIFNKNNIKKAEKLITKIGKYDDILIQEIVKGKEISVSLYGNWNSEINVLGITEIIPKKEFFDYEAKYEGKVKEIPLLKKDFEKLYGVNNTKYIFNISKNIYEHFKIKTLSRIDFIFSENKFHFLEINTIPGFTNTSIYPVIASKYFGDINNFMKIILKT